MKKIFIFAFLQLSLFAASEQPQVFAVYDGKYALTSYCVQDWLNSHDRTTAGVVAIKPEVQTMIKSKVLELSFQKTLEKCLYKSYVDHSLLLRAKRIGFTLGNRSVEFLAHLMVLKTSVPYMNKEFLQEIANRHIVMQAFGNKPAEEILFILKQKLECEIYPNLDQKLAQAAFRIPEQLILDHGTIVKVLD